MESFLADIRHALRIQAKSPGFTAVVLLTLALGIVSNISIFTFVNAALVRPLPYGKPSQLVEIFDTRQMEVFQRLESSYPDFLDWRWARSPAMC